MSRTFKHDDGDLIVDWAGRFITVSGMEKCAQDVAESLLNNWDPDIDMWYNGSELYMVDNDPEMFSVITPEEKIHFAVEEAILRLQELQEDDPQVESDELIEDIRELWVDKLSTFDYVFRVSVVTESEDYVPQDFSISLRNQLPPGMLARDLDSMVPKR